MAGGVVRKKYIWDKPLSEHYKSNEYWVEQNKKTEENASINSSRIETKAPKSMEIIKTPPPAVTFTKEDEREMKKRERGKKQSKRNG